MKIDQELKIVYNAEMSQAEFKALHKLLGGMTSKYLAREDLTTREKDLIASIYFSMPEQEEDEDDE